MEIFTIGHTKRTASGFFQALGSARIERLIDVRLNNRSQLAGFTKAGDLPFFLRQILGVSYHHELMLAPDDKSLRAYRAGEISWESYEGRYLALIRSRRVEESMRPVLAEARPVLMCSEPRPDRCHRRLAAEYLSECWADVDIVHL